MKISDFYLSIPSELVISRSVKDQGLIVCTQILVFEPQGGSKSTFKSKFSDSGSDRQGR